MTIIEQNIIDYLELNPEKSASDLFKELNLEISYATLKRVVNKLVSYFL